MQAQEMRVQYNNKKNVLPFLFLLVGNDVSLHTDKRLCVYVNCEE